MLIERFIPILLALLLSPLMLGLINQTKAFFAGRVGSPWFQTYHDIFKLLKKGAVYSPTTTWIFRAGPLVGLSAILAAFTLLPFGGFHTLISFSGDFILLAYLLAAARFFTVLAALDTGSSFEGMGGSREITFSVLAEPALLLGITALARAVNRLSLGDIYQVLSSGPHSNFLPIIILVAVSLFVILLAENSRIPVDDPNTHLELTMIHEVMVLDHSGPDLAFILYGSALKLWLMSSLLIGIILPHLGCSLWLRTLYSVIGIMGLGVVIGLVESIMARLRLTRIPPLLIGAGACSLFALLLVLQVKQ